MNTETKYTPTEEFLNAFTHSIGALFSIYAIVMLAVSSHNATQAASTAIFAVSSSLISPTSIMSGSCLKTVLNDPAKVLLLST